MMTATGVASFSTKCDLWLTNRKLRVQLTFAPLGPFVSSLTAETWQTHRPCSERDWREHDEVELGRGVVRVISRLRRTLEQIVLQLRVAP